MREVRRGDDDGINSRLCDRFAVVGEDRAHAGLGAGAFDGGAVGVAQRDHLRRRRERQAWQVVREGDFSGSDNRDADAGRHDSPNLTEAVERTHGSNRLPDADRSIGLGIVPIEIKDKEQSPDTARSCLG